MNRKQCIWYEEFEVRSFLVDSQRRLSLFGLLSLLQESAWLHASLLGHGFQETRETGGSWVLARQRVEMERWPEWGQTLTVCTWLRPPGPVLVTRDFEVLVKGERWGIGSAHWLTINHQTRRPIPLPFPDDPALFRQDDCLALEPQKLPIPKGTEALKTFRVCQSDLDMNGHVNNTRFAQWVLDSLPSAVHRSRGLRGYQVNFLAEARLGEAVQIESPKTVSAQTEGRFPFLGRRVEDGKILFVAELR